MVAHQTLMAAWHSVFASKLKLVRDVVEKCNERIVTSGDHHAFVYGELRAAVQATNPEAHRRDVDAHAFGQKLRQLKDRWLSGMCLVQVKKGEDVLWAVKTKMNNRLKKPMKTKAGTPSTPQSPSVPATGR
jgi:hypothetical protein